MQKKLWSLVVVAAVFAAGLGSYLAFGLTLGIDLSGGTVLIYQLQRVDGASQAITEDDVKGTADVLQRRLDTMGTKEMSIRPAGTDQVMIQIPGKDPTESERIKKVLASSGNLFFKIPVGGRTHGQTDPDGYIESILDQKAAGVYDPRESAYDVAFYQPMDDGKKVGAPFPVLLMNDDAVDGKHLTFAGESRQMRMRAAVDFELDRDGAEQLARTTKAHKDKQMCIVLDGQIISAPNINSPIPEGRGYIEGDFTREEMQELITVLRSGALPAKPVLQSEDTIAATLGEDSIRRGLIAVVLAVVVTFAFMFVYYRFAGFIANTALLLNLVVLIGMMALFQSTLTLPGIAGIVLTMGMAVDANILINERIREEFKRGLTISDAVKGGYSNALSAIIDSNLTTFFTAAILYYVGTGPIKGFAVTLAIGIATSMFTALWVTRQLFEIAIDRGFYKEVRYLTILEDSKIDFLARRRPFVIAALIAANLGFFVFVARGDSKYGIDFTGGAAVQMRLAEPRTEDAIYEALAKVEVEVAGRKDRPFAEVEVQRLGAVNDKNEARIFQVLVSAHGQDPAPVPTPEAGVLDEGAPPTQTGWAMELERAMREQFASVLVPEAFSAPRWEEVDLEVADAEAPSGKRTVKRRRMAVEVRFDATLTPEVTKAMVADALSKGEAYAKDAEVEEVAGSPANVRAFFVRTAPLDYQVQNEVVETQVRAAIGSALGRQLSDPFPLKTAIGGAVAESLKARGILAVILSLILMVLYIAFRFELKAGLAAALCLFHDVFVALGFMAFFDLLGFDTNINLTTIAAFLTIVGYSINDTIVTFDRMRENLMEKRITPTGEGYVDMLNTSINQVLPRTLLTSFTVFITLLILALAGVSSLVGFSLAMLVGVVVGTYSSVYVATPLLLLSVRQLGRFIVLQLGALIAIAALFALRG